MKRAILILLFLSALLARGADQRVTLRITVTNLPVTGNNISFSAPASKVVTWSNVTSSSYVATNTTINLNATNLYLQFAAYAPWTPRPILVWATTNAFDLVGEINQNIAATNSGTWATLTLSTQTVTSMTLVRVPIASETYATNRTNIASLLVKGQSDFSTNSFNSNSTALVHFLSIGTNAQTLLGKKTFNQLHGGTNTATIYGGTNQALRIVDAHSIAGTNGNTVGGYNTNGIFDKPTLTNVTVYGGISSPGSAGTGSERFGTGADATGDYSFAIGAGAMATNTTASAMGRSAVAGGENSTAAGTLALALAADSGNFGNGGTVTADGARGFYIGSGSGTISHPDSWVLGYALSSTASNQFQIGTSSQFVQVNGRLVVLGGITNAIFTGTNSNTGDWSDTEVTESTLANGDNTPAFTAGRNVRWAAGPTATFQISGFTGIPRSGQLIDRWNDTGQTMTVNNESGTTGATNRILTLHGTNVVCGTNAFVQFRYSAARSRWLLINVNPAP